eukprot:scaffold285_cov330-Pavlova_lutheri.AAC.70
MAWRGRTNIGVNSREIGGVVGGWRKGRDPARKKRHWWIVPMPMSGMVARPSACHPMRMHGT